MAIRIKNISNESVELDSFGISIAPNQILKVHPEDDDSVEIDEYINNNVLVIMRGNTALSREESQDIVEDNTETRYTNSEIDAMLQGLIDSAPGTLDTINELAAAIGDNPDFAGEVMSLISGKAPANHTHSLPSHHHNTLYYSRSYLNSALGAKSPTNHHHNSSYFTKTEMTSALSGKSPTNHNHNALYYTKHQVNEIVDDVDEPEYGTQYRHATSPGVTAVSRNTWTNKLILNMPMDNQGLYKLNYNYNWMAQQYYGRCECEIYVKAPNGDIKTFHRLNTGQPYYTVAYTRTSGTAAMHTSGTWVYTASTSGTHQIIIKFKSPQSNQQIKMWNTFLDAYLIQN